MRSAIKRKGFTLVEIIVVLVILGILVKISMTAIFNSIEETRAQTAYNNLLAISAAQQKYEEDNGNYCVQPTGNSTDCGASLPNLASNLRLSISATDRFSYSCSSASGAIDYNCSATDGIDTITLNPNAQVPANHISCSGTSQQGANYSSCPVSCVSSKNSNCPTSLQ